MTNALRCMAAALLVASCAASEAEPARSLPDDLLIPWEKPGARAPDHPAQPPVESRPLESCGQTSEGFEGWLESFRRHAVAQRISGPTVAALEGLAYDDEVIAADRSQSAHRLSFAEFIKKHLTKERVARAKVLRKEHEALLAKIETQFGVAPEVLLSIWGLETDYGENTGSMSSLRALATLAYDCRRAERFRQELSSALRILDRGDLKPAEMVGAWAGELGQTQFLPSSYERFAMDFDGDGCANLVGSSADALASTAHYLKEHGWRASEGYGPGSHNFAVLAEWNASEVYRKAIVHFAQMIGRKK